MFDAGEKAPSVGRQPFAYFLHEWAGGHSFRPTEVFMLDRFPTTLRTLVVLVMFGAAGCAEREPAVQPPGAEETTKTRVLEAGAAILQPDDVFEGFDVYLIGFHPMKEEPHIQMEAHHFCRQVNQDFAQCVLFDGNTAEANMTGVEYIISGRLLESLPAEERQYWHPHNFEILSGQLVAPGIPQVAEIELMRDKMNSYGKTFHLWHTTRGEEGQKLPLGPARLAWSFNRMGEARPELISRRDAEMNIDSHEKRRERQELQSLARPQYGVDVLKGAFRATTEPYPGVADAEPGVAGERSAGQVDAAARRSVAPPSGP
jgi:hypothetical protein